MKHLYFSIRNSWHITFPCAMTCLWLYYYLLERMCINYQAKSVMSPILSEYSKSMRDKISFLAWTISLESFMVISCSIDWILLEICETLRLNLLILLGWLGWGPPKIAKSLLLRSTWSCWAILIEIHPITSTDLNSKGLATLWGP